MSILAASYDVTPADLESPRRTKAALRIACYLARREARNSHTRLQGDPTVTLMQGRCLMLFVEYRLEP